MSKTYTITTDGEHHTFSSIEGVKVWVREESRRIQSAEIKSATESKYKKMFAEHGWALVSFKGTAKPMLVVCPNGHDVYVRVSHWKVKKKCVLCVAADERQRKFEHYAKIFASRCYKLTPQEIYSTSQKVSFICDKQHSHEAILSNILKGQGPLCNQTRPKKTIEEIRHYVEMERGYKLVSQEHPGHKNKLELLCPNGHRYYTTWDSFTHGTDCRHCFVAAKSSKAEMDLKSFIESLGFMVEHRTLGVIKPYEIDVWIPEKRVGIEYCGLYWHSEANNKIDSKYHLKKLTKAIDNNARLLTVFEDEWLSKNEQVKGYIEAILGLGKALHAHKCQIRPIDWEQAHNFLNLHHIQGHGSKGLAFGLFYRGELIQVGVFSEHHRQNVRDRAVWKRFAVARGFNVRGGATKLFSFAVDYLGIDEVITFADRRWTEGGVYKKIGFELEATLDPDYSYVIKNNRLERFSQQSLTETEGYLRIYDCGKYRYVWKRK
jgi:hypothetical protein